MDPSGGKPWLLDTIYVIKSGTDYKAQPPTKVVNNLQKVTWDGRGKQLELKPQTGLRDISPNPATTITAIVDTSLPFFEYTMLCDGLPVQGNSPPVIVVE